MTHALGYATRHSFCALAPMPFERPGTGPHDVAIDILYCGVCHSDLHQVRNDWKNTIYPCMPGHEIVGRVRAVGSHVRSYARGDLVGVGCMVGSCGVCPSCRESLEQYCEGPVGCTWTSNGPTTPDGTNTFGGFSTHIVVPERFVLRIPRTLPVQGVPPLLCAGVTSFSALRHWQAGPGMRVGVVGLGGLGHLAVQLAAALGAQVTVFSRSASKAEDARRFGAVDFVLSTDGKAMKAHARSLDLIVSTVPESHDLNPYVSTLSRDGNLVVVGLLGPLGRPTDLSEVALSRRSISGSLIGGIRETQEALDFCAEHRITAQVEVIPITGVNDAFKRMHHGEVRYRSVIDIATTLALADGVPA